MLKRSLAALSAILCAGVVAMAANIPLITGPTPAADLQSILNTLIQQINTLVTPQTMGQYATQRNYLDNGAMNVQQRGTGIVTCADNTAPTTAAYSADRWVCDVNVASGAGRAQVITATPSPPPGFAASLKVYRTSGALTQPVCVYQEVSTARSIQLQGQPATFSFYAQALAGLSADNSNVISFYILTGTGSDQGFGTLTASPAITPAWTGIATNASAATTITTAWARYSMTATIPTSATEIAVAICFTPTATGAGTTDGFAFVGAQLEQGSATSQYEYRPYGIELIEAQRYYVQFSDNQANTFTLPATCAETTSGTVAACTMILPVTMRVAPTSAVATATSYGMTKAADGTAGACSTLAVIASSNTLNTVGLTCALSETAAVGTMHRLIYANTGVANTITISADF